MNKVTGIMIVGVGGQGVILASELLCEAAMRAGYDVKKSEVHGMAQRGGSVVSNVRFGKKVYSPLISKGEADILLSFEQLETLRWLDYIKPEGKIIVNMQKIMPMAVAIGQGEYPEDIFGILKRKTDKIYRVDGLGIARKAGNVKAVNVAIIGALSNYLDIPEGIWEEVIENRVPPKTLKINLTAFEMGRNYGQE
ncbi:MAG: indolepyruvate oxidoreductase subunit beta [Firmicutes bacterium]|nr:indolepyruvate oxidoreductase subunit beta [Bacillota bacterium]